MLRFNVVHLLCVGLALGSGSAAGCGGASATNAPPAAASAAPASSSPTSPSTASSSPTSPSTASSSPTSPSTASPSPSPEDEEAAGDLGEHHRHHHHGGVTMFIAMSLDSLGVSPDQAATIEKIQGDLFAKMEPAHLAEQGLIGVLADGVGAGKIDDTKVEAAIGKVKSTAAGVQQASLESLKQLHSTLTPEQRGALVDKVEAHWEVWKNVNNQNEMAGDAEHPGHLDRVAKDLGLTSDQVDKIRSTFADKVKTHPHKFDPAQVEAHIKDFGTAFKSAAFDPKGLKQGPFAHEHMAVWGARRMAHFYEAIVSVLTPDQRTKLAGELREHAAAKSGILDADKHER